MKIYTRGGDKGKTSLRGGLRVSKNHLRVHAYGTVDELNSLLGLVLASPGQWEDREWIIGVQRDLFVIGSWLSNPQACEGFGQDCGETKEKLLLDQKRIESLESAIDSWEAGLPPLKNFILPGGAEAGSRIHLARAVCRRAERECMALVEAGEKVPDLVIQYMNRLSDALFVLARYANHQESVRVEEIKWL